MSCVSPEYQRDENGAPDRRRIGGEDRRAHVVALPVERTPDDIRPGAGSLVAFEEEWTRLQFLTVDQDGPADLVIGLGVDTEGHPAIVVFHHAEDHVVGNVVQAEVLHTQHAVLRALPPYTGPRSYGATHRIALPDRLTVDLFVHASGMFVHELRDGAGAEFPDLDRFATNSVSWSGPFLDQDDSEPRLRWLETQSVFTSRGGLRWRDPLGSQPPEPRPLDE